jgi:hypothetical protein
MGGPGSERLSLEEFQNMASGIMVEPLVLGAAALQVAQVLWRDRRDISGDLPPGASQGFAFAQPYEAEDEVLVDRRGWRFQNPGAFPVAKEVATQFSAEAHTMGEYGIYSVAQRGVKNVARLLLAASMERAAPNTTPTIIEIIHKTNHSLHQKGVRLILPYDHFSTIGPY